MPGFAANTAASAVCTSSTHRCSLRNATSQPRSTLLVPRQTTRAVRIAASPNGAAATSGDAAVSTTSPQVTITVTTKEGPSTTISCESGDQLRAVLLANKVDVYTTWGKVWQCGGVGNCGTCIVEVKEGADLLSEKTKVEGKKLGNKPGSWRLACQTLVGDGTNSGAIVIGTKPQ